MMDPWPKDTTKEERSLRLFKDALMRYSVEHPWSFLSDEADEAAGLAASKVENAYARVREHVPEELKGDALPAYAGILSALRNRTREGESALPSRRVLVHVLAGLDYYFYRLTLGYERAYDMPHLTDEERAAEHGLRHDLLLKLYDELEPAFDVSLRWPPDGYKVTEKGELAKVEAVLTGMTAIGYDYGYDAEIFYEGHADDQEFVKGFVEGCLDRIAEDEPEEADFLRNLWEGGDEEDRASVLEMLKEECEVREGRFDDRPEFPV